MKKNYTPMIMMLILSSFLFGKILYDGINPKKEIVIIPIKFNETNNDTLSTDNELNSRFDYVFHRFKVFNPDLDTSTVILFNNVCTHYKLDTTEEMFELCVGQILLESGAKQYYQTNHPKSGKLVVSSAGAIGITQIMPATAYGNLKNYVSDDDIKDMLDLGCTPFNHIIDSTCGKSDGIKLSREWLKDERNNIILWGFIMRKKLNKRPSMLKVLVSYNAGTTGMIKFVNNGGLLNLHKYIKGIKIKLKYAEDKINDSLESLENHH